MTTKNFEKTQLFTMWLKSTKDKKNTFLSGQMANKERLVGFINGMKKNPNEPDMRIYKVDAEGKAEKESFASLWVNLSKADKKYISGVCGDVKLVGFFGKGGVDDKIPYFTIYESTPLEEKADQLPDQEEMAVPF